jgi:hypothetical protein
VHREVAYGHEVPLDSYRMSPGRVAGQLAEVGVTVHTRTFREPQREFETTPQAFLLARG